jgi:hypothetical protein
MTAALRAIPPSPHDVLASMFGRELDSGDDATSRASRNARVNSPIRSLCARLTPQPPSPNMASCFASCDAKFVSHSSAPESSRERQRGCSVLPITRARPSVAHRRN